jgi:uncharacterized protein
LAITYFGNYKSGKQLARFTIVAMSISEKINQDIVTAMKAKDGHRLTTLRMMKSGIRSREIDKRSPVDDQETIQILSTMIKQRKDSVEQFTKGGRQELADKETAEIKIIEGYMPQSAGEEEITATVRAVIAEMGAPTIKDMGTVMKGTMAKFAASGTRVDGKVVSETVKRELSPK